jgi:uncharacterized protein (TIGR04255 family)
MARYKRNYLTHVIIKVDFEGVLSIDNELPPAIAKKASSIFPLFEPKPSAHQEFNISADGAKLVKRIESTNWIFRGTNREKVLSISRENLQKEHTSLMVDYSKYESFDNTKNEFISILDAILDTFPESKIIRVGLRYINSINLNEKNPFTWNKYINSTLLNSFKFVKDREFISRSFHNLELKYDDMNVRFQYGMHNPDYPSVIKKKEFILDYDAYFSGEQDKNEIPKRLETYHDYIESLFENSIKDGLRDKMNE